MNCGKNPMPPPVILPACVTPAKRFRSDWPAKKPVCMMLLIYLLSEREWDFQQNNAAA